MSPYRQIQYNNPHLYFSERPNPDRLKEMGFIWSDSRAPKEMRLRAEKQYYEYKKGMNDE